MIYAFTQANIENSLGRMKTKEIIAAVNNLKVVFKRVCDKCAALPSETSKLLNEFYSVCSPHFDRLLESTKSDTEGQEGIIDELRQAFQAVCLTCSKVSNDDNPSNHGQTFVSLDSGNCQANTGRAKSSHTDDNVVLSRADWIGLHRAPELEDSSGGMSPALNLMMKEEPEAFKKREDQSSTSLPPEVEDRLRTEFANFQSLDIIDKLLLSCILSGMNIAEFAKMLWFPYSIVDPKTRVVKSITKQAAHARWINICKRFPVFMAVAASSARDNRKSMEKLRKFVLNPNGEEASNRFANGKLLPAYSKAAKKESSANDKKKDERIAKLESELSIMKKENAEYKKAIKKAEKPLVERRGRKKANHYNEDQGLLPGLF